MHILLTGGTGLIGSALIKRWQGQHRLTVLTRSRDTARRRFGAAITAVASLAEVDFNHIDAVINLAGEPIVSKRWSERQKQVLCNSRWLLTQALVDAIASAATPPAVLISGSAVGIYGAQQDQLITEENQNYTEDFPHLLCQRWEDIALKAKTEQTRVCLLRTGIVLATEGGALKKMLLPFRLGLGGKTGTGQQYMPWVHLQDMLQIIEFLLAQPSLQGPFNVVAPTPVTNAEFSSTLADTLHKPALLPIPALVLHALLGEMAILLLSGQRVIPDNLHKAGYNFSFTELKPALKALLQ